MDRCLYCDMVKFCLGRLSDETITGCTLRDYVEGRISWSEIQIEHTIDIDDIDDIKSKLTSIHNEGR